MSDNNAPQYYYLDANRTPQGPISLEDLRAAYLRGELPPGTQAACKGASSWQTLGNMFGGTPAADSVELPPPPAAELGNCPSCGQMVMSVEGGSLPVRCPHCNRALRAETPDAMGYLRHLWAQGLSASGRSRRAEFIAFHILANAAVFLFTLLPFLAFLTPFLTLGFTVFAIPVTIRRLHDTGRSAFSVWAFVAGAILLFIPMVAVIYHFLLPMLKKLSEMASAGITPDEQEVTRLVEEYLSSPGMLTDFIEEHTLALQIWSYGVIAVCILSIYILVVCLLDSKAGANKYGPSPKYPLAR